MNGEIHLAQGNAFPAIDRRSKRTEKTGNIVVQNPVSSSPKMSNSFECSKKDPTDKSNDGKFSCWEAAKNFGKGLVSPVTSMFSSVKNFAIGAGMIAASTALIFATGGAVTPILIAAGVAMGGIQAGNATYKILTAKDGDDVEKAFFDAGAATSTIGLSVFGAKASLKQAGIATEGMNAFSATVKCFTASRTSVVNSFNAFKTGAWRTNLANAVKPFTKSRQLSKLSSNLHEEGNTRLNSAVEEVKSILPDELQGSVKGRYKGKSSIYDKLNRIIKELNEEIDKLKQEPNSTTPEMQAKIKKMIAKRDGIRNDLNIAREQIYDLIGTRLVLDDASPAQMDKIVSSLVKAIEEGKITVTSVSNYRGSYGNPYFSDTHIEMLKLAAQKRGQSIKFLEGPKETKASGYTTTQMNITHKNGALGEFQIRGSHINELAEFEHIPYDLRQGKDLSRGIRKIGELFEPVKRATTSLSKEEYAVYQDYLARMYEYSRQLEMGLFAKKPEFPQGMDEILRVENLGQLHHQAKIISKNHANDNITPIQARGVIYSGISPLLQDDRKLNCSG
jgi:hypothetical protein